MRPVRFAEIVGEPTRSPNKKFLLRRIGEALEGRAEETEVKAEERVSEKAAKPRRRGRFADMTVEELQAMYLDVVGRPTASASRSYLQWKIREAEKGRIPVGPRKRRERNPEEMKVLPLRMAAETVEALDEVWRRHGLKSRTELFRQALDQYLTALGEEVAASRGRGVMGADLRRKRLVGGWGRDRAIGRGYRIYLAGFDERSLWELRRPLRGLEGERLVEVWRALRFAWGS